MEARQPACRCADRVGVVLRGLLVLWLCAVALSAIGVGGCGSAENRSGAASDAHAHAGAVFRVPSGPLGHDEDGDIDTLGMGYDADNDSDSTYGPPASPAERRAIVAFIRRYYEVAAAGEGAAACSMLDPITAETLVERHHRGHGPRSLQGESCAQIVSKLFRARHRELVEDLASFRISLVDVRGNRGVVFAPFALTREMQLIVHREHGGWGMEVPLDNGAV
jgi:hypothetical protein